MSYHRTTVLFITIAACGTQAALANEPYARIGWEAHIPAGSHNVEGVATIIDEHTIQIEHFNYDGQAPLVYFYLGADNTYSAFANGLGLEPLLNRAYNDESLTLTLPEGETLDDYGAISVWCAQFHVNFSSAAFAPPAQPYARTGQVARLVTFYHTVYGAVRIVNDHLLHATHFTFDGGGPAVYFYLGATNTYTGFREGIGLLPQLNTPYVDASRVLELPAGESMDAYHAVSVWCAAVSVDFGSNTFMNEGDFDDDGDTDIDDADIAEMCLVGPDETMRPVSITAEEFAHADTDSDHDVDLRDWADFQLAYSD